MGNLYITPEGVSRLRNLRSRKRIAREDHEKYLRECIKRQKALFKQRRELPLVPLEKPYQNRLQPPDNGTNLGYLVWLFFHS